MTTLRCTHPFTRTLCLFVAVGCSSHIQLATGSGGIASSLPTGGTGPVVATGGHFGTSGGTGGIGGAACCSTLPKCDNATDIPWYPSGTSTYAPDLNVVLYYTRSACCMTVYCIVPTTSSSGGTGSFPGTETGGNSGSPFGGTWGNGAGGAETGGAPNTSPNAHCTYGMNQTCNDDLRVSAVYGQCQPDGYCNCYDGYYPSLSTGKCTTYDQTVCYSPTQNIDKAYVDRAFGCNCYSATDKPWCGIDSSGLRVYLSCTSSNQWQSGATANCSPSPSGGASASGGAGAVGGTAALGGARASASIGAPPN